MHRRFVLLLLLLLTSMVAHAESGVKLTKEKDRVRIEIDGQLFSNYFFEGVPRPVLFPIIAPGGKSVTRDWPMFEGSTIEERDHPHHRGLWFAYGSLNGYDFWSEQKEFGKTVHDKFVSVKSGRERGIIQTRNKWVAPNGDIVCTDERTIRIHRGDDKQRVLDYEVTLKASHGSLLVGDTKEGMMAIRLAETMRQTGKHATGTIENSNGVTNGATWGKRAAWCDYHGLVDGERLGVTIMDHPENPRHPTWWHVRDYGLFAANPFGLHDFEKKPANAGDMRLPNGASITFRYRFIIHKGDTVQARADAQFREYAKEVHSKNKSLLSPLELFP